MSEDIVIETLNKKIKDLGRDVVMFKSDVEYFERNLASTKEQYEKALADQKELIDFIAKLHE